MRWIAFGLIFAAAQAGAQAEPPAPGPGPLGRGIENMMRDLFDGMEPALRELRERLGTLDDYEAPEMLPNGDIILRRKQPLEPEEEPEPRIVPDEPVEI